MDVKCKKCGHLLSWHHGNELQERLDGVKYIRTCYGIACICTDFHGDVIHKKPKIKTKKHWILRLIKRQKIKANIIYKRQYKKFRRRYIKFKNKRHLH